MLVCMEGNESFADDYHEVKQLNFLEGDILVSLLINISVCAGCSDVLLPRAVVPHLLIGCSLLPSMSGLGGGAEKVLKLRDRGREEGREACLRRSPSSI